MLARECMLALLGLGQASCGYGLQAARVESSFTARFGCDDAVVTGVSDGWHIEGCGRTAEYACFGTDDAHHSYRSGGEFLADVLVSSLFAGMNERCVLASTEETPLIAAVPSAAPAHVQRLEIMRGGAVIKTRTLFAGGHIAALARPSLHPQHALLIVHTTARLPSEPCGVALTRDGAAVSVAQQARVGDYEQHLVLPLAELHALSEATQVHGTVCGVALDLDASGRATLGAFAAQFRAERTKIEQLNARAPATTPSTTTLGGKPGWRWER